MEDEKKKKEDMDKLLKRAYNNGRAIAILEKQAAILIGEAILKVLDERYEFKKEDY